MSNTQPRYYVLRPVSEAKVDPVLIMFASTVEMANRNKITHYLSPVTEDEIRGFSKEQYAWEWIQQLNHEKSEHLKEKDELVKEVEELREWKRQAMAVMPDYQAIAKVLDIPLGQSVHDKILPALEGMVKEVERLKGLLLDAYHAGAYLDTSWSEFKQQNNL